jgi:hypothetical protein
MKKLLPLLLLMPTHSLAQEVYSINVNRFCAAVVDIPYASDNFSDEEWEEFKQCLQFVEQFREY